MVGWNGQSHKGTQGLFEMLGDAATEGAAVWTPVVTARHIARFAFLEVAMRSVRCSAVVSVLLGATAA